MKASEKLTSTSVERFKCPEGKKQAVKWDGEARRKAKLAVAAEPDSDPRAISRKVDAYVEREMKRWDQQQQNRAIASKLAPLLSKRR